MSCDRNSYDLDGDLKMSVCVKIISAASLWFALNSAVYASATLTSVQGAVQANTGSGFTAVSASTTLKTGDRVMVGAHSSAILTYDNGCSVRIKPGEVTSVLKEGICNFGTTQQPGTVPGSAGGAGATAGAAGVAAIAIGAGAAALVISNRKSTSSP